MDPVLGWLLFLAIAGGCGAYFRHVYREASASGAFKGTPGGLRGAPARAKITGQRARHPVTTAAARKTGTTVSPGSPVKVRHIAAQAIAANWIDRRRHIRVNGKPRRRPPLGRLPGRREPSPAPAPVQPAPAAVKIPDPAHPPSANGHRPAAPTGGTPMSTPTTTTAGTGSGAAGDLFSALNRLTTEARAGGIRSKARVNLVMGAGFEQQAAALEQHARDLQENGLYPPSVYEPVQQGAGMLRAAAMKLTESGNEIAGLAKTPAGELVGRAPARDELNKG